MSGLLKHDHSEDQCECCGLKGAKGSSHPKIMGRGSAVVFGTQSEFSPVIPRPEGERTALKIDLYFRAFVRKFKIEEGSGGLIRSHFPTGEQSAAAGSN
ncbi:hypothetical protein Ddc_11532 [Ditylenchus destructor]|nr:hypothetical protein Ddc_11532 [Ditylenchus destructor]